MAKRTGLRRRIALDVGWAEADPVDTVEVGDHLVPRVIDVVFAGADGQPRLEMRIDSSSGVPQCRELHLVAAEGGREVRPTDLRLVTTEVWKETIVPLFMDPITQRGPGGAVTAVSYAPDTNADHYKRAKAALRQAKRADRRKVTPELLRRVAEVYAQNELRPAEAVRDAFVVSGRTAYRYIRLAREQGYLTERRDKS